MWFPTPKNLPDWSAAESHLRSDPKLAAIIDRVGPCLLTPRRNYFPALCEAIFTQQVSMTVAAVLFARFRRLFPRRQPTPPLVLALTDADLQSAGLSRQKRSYIRDLATHFATGQMPIRRFPSMSDDQIIDSLIAVKGIGRWTAEMFLIFVLNRPDLLPVDDLGVRKAAQQLFALPALPKPDGLIRLAAPWRPWRTVATWYLWRSVQ